MTPGTRIGPYEVIASLGAGGMGEVYRARDTKLNRDVAIKVLLSSVAHDADRLSRFGREAQLLAALNHPNIAHIHGLEDSAGVPALVMELVEGPTLADRIAQGAIPVDEALPIARQIAEALEAAHHLGIIHRDLKPANIKVRADGTVKVLDFGLAKALDPLGASSTDATTSPTLTLHATQAGVILGTAAYMSPEQARGKVVDARTDIWAFGCVVFEMLTGQRAFHSDDVTDTIVAVVSREPDWQALPPAASSLRPLLTRCLRKDPKQRLQAIGDARIQIDELLTGAVPEAPSFTTKSPRGRLVAVVAITALIVGVVIGALVSWALWRAPQIDTTVSRVEIVLPSALMPVLSGGGRDIAISPDGRFIVYLVMVDQRFHLAIRAISERDARLIPGTPNARQPIFSPDGQWVAFFDGSSLKKVAVTGGAPITICATPPGRGASWGEDGNIVFASFAGELLRVSAGGGEPTVLRRPDPPSGETRYWYPSLLPNGRGVLFTITAQSRAQSGRVAVLDLQTQQHKILLREGSQAAYVHSGHLVYAFANTLRSVRFDPGRLEVLSDPVPVVDSVSMTDGGGANYAFSRTTLVYIPARAPTPRSLLWVDRKGQETPISAPPRLYAEPRLSPDGSRVALAAADQENDIWMWDLAGNRPLTRLTSDPGIDLRPTWTPDGQRIVFASQRSGAFNLFVQSADGTGVAERLTTGPNTQLPASVAVDASGVVGSEISPQTAGDIVWFPFRRPASQSAPGGPSSSNPSPVERMVHTPTVEYNPDVSPNWRYLAYQSNESGQNQIYVRPFPQADDGWWQVTTEGGTRPLWARNGRELFYLDLAHRIMAVPVQTAGRPFVHGNPARVFDTVYAVNTTPFEHMRPFDVSLDGQRFLLIKDEVPQSATTTGIHVVLNWLEELKGKVR